ncbi:MAG: T9SS type A sorting domain-containing protein, partial [Saprospiraceae bacterium]
KLNAVYLNANFLGIKIGDINLSLSNPLQTVADLASHLEERDRPASPKGNLIKVFPNPFNQNSTLLFNSDRKEIFNLVIFDLSGKVLSNRKVDAIQGMNKISLESGTFKSEGVYYFKLEGSDNRYSGKLYRFR